jgi:hypothetical protein
LVGQLIYYPFYGFAVLMTARIWCKENFNCWLGCPSWKWCSNNFLEWFSSIILLCSQVCQLFLCMGILYLFFSTHNVYKSVGNKWLFLPFNQLVIFYHFRCRTLVISTFLFIQAWKWEFLSSWW